MFKIIKTKISAAEGASTIGLNANYRTTISYNDDKTISVTVDKVKRPELTRDEEQTLVFEEVDQRTYSESDFLMSTDNGSWFVDFDVSSGKLTNPIDVYDWMASANSGDSNFHVKIQDKVFGRYNSEYLPVFNLKTLDKDSSNFQHSVLICYVADSTIVNAVGSVSMDSTECREWLESNVKPEITYSILDSSNQSVGVLVASQKNRYKTTLPAGVYTVNVSCNKTSFAETSNTYGLSNVNGLINKNRLVLADGDSSPVTVDLSGLVSGEYFKLKLNYGKFISYAELWIEIQ
jgi:hypothetical protein